jgi:aminoglycoside phosphotransferase (APT) family kinase protein
MSNQILEYSPEIDKKIFQVIPQILGVNVKRIIRISQGEVNYVYKVETENQVVLVRIARYKNWPDIGKLTWIFEQLTKRNIPHAEILFSDTSSKYFKFGFMINKWIDGEDGMSLIKEGKITRRKAIEKIARTLLKLHQITIQGFGDFDGDGQARYRTWKESLLYFLKDASYRRAVKEGKYENNLNIKGIKMMNKLVTEANYEPRSVLVHRDAMPENAVFSPEAVVLIDWDDAIGSTWIEDLAWITYWMGEESRAWFLGVYKTNEPLELIKKVEKIIHLKLAITLIPYYVYATKNYEAADRMKNRLKTLIAS